MRVFEPRARAALVSDLHGNPRASGRRRGPSAPAGGLAGDTSRNDSGIKQGRSRRGKRHELIKPPARTYNQAHVATETPPGKRRISIYWTWSYPWEAAGIPRRWKTGFSTMTEVRQVPWPAYETPEYSAVQFLQGIAGTLELFHRSTLAFQQIAGEATGHPVAMFQRIDQAGYRLPIDEGSWPTRHPHGLRPRPPSSEQDAAPDEVAAIRRGSSAKARACCSRRTTTSVSPTT